MINLDPRFRTTPPDKNSGEAHSNFVTVQDLEILERQRVLERLQNLKPELIEAGVKVRHMAMLLADEAERVREELHLIVGGDGVSIALQEFDIRARALIAAAKAAPPAPGKAAPPAKGGK